MQSSIGMSSGDGHASTMQHQIAELCDEGARGLSLRHVSKTCCRALHSCGDDGQMQKISTSWLGST